MDLTTWFVIIGTVLILSVDVVLLARGGEKATISDHMRAWSHKWPVVAFLWGFLMGHFYG
jgi:uncharacterized integral membrane protein